MNFVSDRRNRMAESLIFDVVITQLILLLACSITVDVRNNFVSTEYSKLARGRK